MWRMKTLIATDTAVRIIITIRYTPAMGDSVRGCCRDRQTRTHTQMSQHARHRHRHTRTHTTRTHTYTHTHARTYEWHELGRLWDAVLDAQSQHVEGEKHRETQSHLLTRPHRQPEACNDRQELGLTGARVAHFCLVPRFECLGVFKV